MPAITASSTCAVQMLLVAFSRRMCCSRVCSAMRSAGVAVRVLRDADEPPGHLALAVVARREERRVRAAEAQRHAEALRAADRDVGAELARRRQQRQREQIGRHATSAPASCARSHERRASRAIAPSVAGYCSSTPNTSAANSNAAAIADDAPRCRAAAARVRTTSIVCGWQSSDDEERRRRRRRRLANAYTAPSPRPPRCLVEQRRVRDRQPGQVGDHRLEVEQRLEPALRDLRLVGRVLRVPARVLEDVALDHRRRDAVGVAHADERPPDLVLRRQRAQLVEHRRLGHRRRQLQRAREPDVGGHGLRDQLVERGDAERAQHLGVVARVGADVALRRTSSLGPRSTGHPGCSYSPCSRQERLVRRRVEQSVQLLGVAERHLDHPALVVGIFVDVFGRVRERRVDLDDLAGDRREQVGDGLDRFDRPEDLGLP